MANKSVVRLDDSRFPNADTFSVRAEVELENGFVGKLGAIEEGNADARALETPVAGDSLVLIANPAIIYDNGRQGSGLEVNYVMKAGKLVRAYNPRPTFVFGVSKEGINGTAVVGEYLVSGAGHKLVPSATLPATGFAAKVVREDAVGGMLTINTTQTPVVYVVMEVVQN